MLSAAQLEQRRNAGRSRAKAFDSDYQSSAAKAKSPESLAEAGRAGNRANVAKYGPQVSARRAARWRRTHPTALARTVAGWLDAAFVQYQTEVEIAGGRAFCDFTIYSQDGRRIDIEPGAAYYHTLPGAAERDAAHDDLVTARGYAVVRLSDADVASGAAKEILSRAIGVNL